MKPEEKTKPTQPAHAYAVDSVDLDRERRKMLERDGLGPDALDEMVKMKRGSMYDAIIRAYYQGQDEGFNAGMVNTMKAARPGWFFMLLGLAVFPMCWVLWKIGIVLYYVLTFTPPTN